MVIRLETKNISQLSRMAQGVRLINLKENQLVTSISIINKEENIDEETNEILENESSELSSGNFEKK